MRAWRYLPHHARLAGGIAMSLADAVLSPAGGETAVAMQATVSLTDYAISTSRVLACHDCGRCRAWPRAGGPRQAAPPRRECAGLRADGCPQACRDAARPAGAP